ncbi:hypothetical protein CfE428DRAFT_4989 [Chthoniobacter flavus Ellin428]|uniref:PEP-CTERM protein-sorting domain-containing protein n=1 Tax=Chthoniobacter flavus Ellin428 TaxID=497964 RepID=B4D7U9_9BACT|nr:hypothetical protein [Chthoniobacter flavus]EDY17472.1 hypothetical protein CfE428DRAFT_4989 [Chthoniobacter flavus Ellin428]TCO92268.1 hypothetical protein EV701_10637 [Chthoniobacter flavus]
MKLKLSSFTTPMGALLLSLSALLASQPAHATTINLNDPSLSPAPTDPGTINGAVFTTNFTQPAGTGVIDPFLTIQSSPTEQGYNGTNGNFDTKRVPQWNHPLTLGSLAEVSLNGQQYYQFVVDVNEPNATSTSTISLDMLSVWTSPTLQSSTSTNSSGLFNGSLGTLRYNMSPSLGSNDVLYFDGNSGSGQADISIYIPVSDFAGASASDYVYMYQMWGNTLPSSGGYEETFAVEGSNLTSVPETSALLPLFAVLGMIIGGPAIRRKLLPA